MRVCVIGLGTIGLATAKYVVNKGLEVWGYDISSEAVERAKKEGIINSTCSWDEIPPSNVYLICVYTGLKGESPDISPIIDVCKKIKKRIDTRPVPLVSIESTIIPGLSRKIFEEIFEKRIYLVHVPHRYWAERPDKYGVKQIRVIGGVNPESLKIGIEFYRDFLDIPLHVVSSVEVAEMSKIAENAYRYVQIAFAEELRMICEELGIDFEEVRDACNTKWNIEILEARNGIGGHCLPKDIRYLASITSFNTLLRSSILVDKKYRTWLSKRDCMHKKPRD